MSLPIPGAMSVPVASSSPIISRTSAGCGSVSGLTRTRPRIRRMLQGRPQRQRAAHRLTDDDDPRGARRQPFVGGGDFASPVRPSGRHHVGDVGAVAGQPRHLDMQAGVGHRRRDAAHRRRAPGESVQGQHPAGVPGCDDATTARRRPRRDARCARSRPAILTAITANHSPVRRFTHREAPTASSALRRPGKPVASPRCRRAPRRGRRGTSRRRRSRRSARRSSSCRSACSPCSSSGCSSASPGTSRSGCSPLGYCVAAVLLFVRPIQAARAHAAVRSAQADACTSCASSSRSGAASPG